MLAEPSFANTTGEKISSCDRARIRVCLMANLQFWFYVLSFRWGMFRIFSNSTAPNMITDLVLAMPCGFAANGIFGFL